MYSFSYLPNQNLSSCLVRGENILVNVFLLSSMCREIVYRLQFVTGMMVSTSVHYLAFCFSILRDVAIFLYVHSNFYYFSMLQIGGRQKKLLKSRKKAEGKSEEKMIQDFRGNWPSSTNPAGQFDNSLALQLGTSSYSVITKHSQLQGVEPLQYQRTSNPLVHQPFYAIAANTYPAAPLLSQIQPGDLQHQPIISHDISPGGMNRVDKPANSFVKSLTMTPQEKIEKLRRRQQMQAMLAIHKQQQQFKNQVSTTSQSISPTCTQEIQSQLIEKTDLDSEEMHTLPALDPKSPLEQDDSNTVSTAVDRCSMEDTILCRLQEIISKVHLTCEWIIFLL